MSRNGVVTACQAAGHVHDESQSAVPLCGNRSHPPGRGDPLRSATSFLLECTPVDRCFTLPLAHTQVISREQNFTSLLRFHKWHVDGKVSLSSNSKRRWRSNARLFAPQSRRLNKSAIGSARACFCRGNTLPISYARPPIPVTARCWSGR